MNKNTYKLKYSTKRATWVVVSEHTATEGKAHPANPANTSTATHSSPLKTTLISIVAAITTAYSPILWAVEPASILIDPNQDTQAKPIIGVANNNVPVINIVPPNQSGVSNNRFIDYQVPAQGVILNNSGSGSTTQLGGNISGNPMLGNNHAATIINQVTGSKATTILGNHEIAGNRANLVIANPNGITINGGAPIQFSGAPKVVLTTGTPNLGADGKLDNYRVTQGTINIQGAGINTESTYQLDLISRTASIAAELRVKQGQLNLIMGQNEVKSDYSSITPLDLTPPSITMDGETQSRPTSTNSSPTIAIDVKELGSMYAGQMNLIATEKGVGVNNAGTIALTRSAAGNNASLYIDVNGNLTNTGKISAGEYTPSTAGTENSSTEKTTTAAADSTNTTPNTNIPATQANTDTAQTAHSKATGIEPISSGVVTPTTTPAGETLPTTTVDANTTNSTSEQQTKASTTATTTNTATSAQTANTATATTANSNLTPNANVSGKVKGADTPALQANNTNAPAANGATTNGKIKDSNALNTTSTPTPTASTVTTATPINPDAANGNLSISTTGDINNVGGAIEGRTVNLYAGGNINNLSTVKTDNSISLNMGTETIVNTVRMSISEMQARHEATVSWLSQWGVSNSERYPMDVRGDMSQLVAITTEAGEYGLHLFYGGAWGVPFLKVISCDSESCELEVRTEKTNYLHPTVIDKTATIKAYGADQTQTYTTTDGKSISYQTTPLTLSAGGDITLKSSGVSSEGGAKLYGKNINLDTHEVIDVTNDPDGKTKDINYTVVEASNGIHTKGDLLLSSEQDTHIRAGKLMSDNGSITLLADKINIESGKAIRDTYHYKKKENVIDLGIFGKIVLDYTVDEDSSHHEDGVESEFIANSILMGADNGIKIRGARLFGANSIDLYTTRGDIDILSHETKHDEQSKHQEVDNFDISFTLSDIHFGKSNKTTEYQGGKSAYIGTDMNSLGNINLTSGEGNIRVEGGSVKDQDTGQMRGSSISTLAGDINMTGHNISITDVNDTSWYKLVEKYSFTGLKVQISNPILDSIRMGSTLYNQAQNADGAAQYLGVGLSTALAGYNLWRNLNNPLSLSGSISLTHDTHFKETYNTQSNSQAATVLAGGALNLTATGAGKSDTADTIEANTGSDIFIQGSKVAGTGGTNLTADDDIHILSGISASNTKTKSGSDSTSIGLGVSTINGPTVNLAYNGSDGHTEDEEVINNESYVGDKNSTTTIKTGDDMLLSGSQVYGKKLNATIGGNLMIRSLQDRMKYDSESKSYGASLSVPIGWNAQGFSANVNAGSQTIKSDYQSVNEQAGIFSGAEGHDIKVGGKTELTSSVIVSTAELDKQNLTTRELTINKDLTNSAAYNANAISLSMGYDSGGGGLRGFTPGLPAGMHASDSAKGEVHSTMTGNVTADTIRVESGGGLNSIGSIKLYAKDIINNGNIAVNNDLGIHAERLLNWGTIAAKGTIDRNSLLNEGLERITANATSTPIDTTLAEPLKKIFDLEHIQTGFDIATTLGANMSEFISIKAKDRDAVGQNPVASVNGEPLYERDKDSPDGYKHDAQGNRIPISTVAQAYANGYQAWELNETSGAQLTEFTSMTRTWGNGGWGTIVLTSLAGAVSGNVTGGAAQLIQNSAINVIQQYAAQGNKAIADAVNNPALSEVVRGLLHAITSCVATDTKGGSCAEGATAAASTVALNSLFNVEVKNMTEAEKLAYSNLIQSIVAGVAFGGGYNAANAGFNALAEVENNGLMNMWRMIKMARKVDKYVSTAADLADLKKPIFNSPNELILTPAEAALILSKIFPKDIVGGQLDADQITKNDIAFAQYLIIQAHSSSNNLAAFIGFASDTLPVYKYALNYAMPTSDILSNATGKLFQNFVDERYDVDINDVTYDVIVNVLRVDFKSIYAARVQTGSPFLGQIYYGGE